MKKYVIVLLCTILFMLCACGKGRELQSRRDQIIKEQQDGKRLYFGSDGYQTVYVFYRDAKWAADFTKTTGMLEAAGQEAIEHLGMDKSNVLYVGDSLIDAQTAQSAG